MPGVAIRDGVCRPIDRGGVRDGFRFLAGGGVPGRHRQNDADPA